MAGLVAGGRCGRSLHRSGDLRYRDPARRDPVLLDEDVRLGRYATGEAL
ncbi:MAG: hypothetical protein U1E48_03155 [Paracoccaceae bacterium]